MEFSKLPGFPDLGVSFANLPGFPTLDLPPDTDADQEPVSDSESEDSQFSPEQLIAQVLESVKGNGNDPSYDIIPPKWLYEDGIYEDGEFMCPQITFLDFFRPPFVFNGCYCFRANVRHFKNNSDDKEDNRPYQVFIKPSYLKPFIEAGNMMEELFRISFSSWYNVPLLFDPKPPTGRTIFYVADQFFKFPEEDRLSEYRIMKVKWKGSGNNVYDDYAPKIPPKMGMSVKSAHYFLSQEELYEKSIERRWLLKFRPKLLNTSIPAECYEKQIGECGELCLIDFPKKEEVAVPPRPRISTQIRTIDNNGDGDDDAMELSHDHNVSTTQSTLPIVPKRKRGEPIAPKKIAKKVASIVPIDVLFGNKRKQAANDLGPDSSQEFQVEEPATKRPRNNTNVPTLFVPEFTGDDYY